MKQTSTKNSKKRNNLTIGALGEEIACRFLVGQKFDLIDRNFRQKCGEIDIIAEKWGTLHFIEVKTVSRENKYFVNRETGAFRPEDNMHFRKIERLQRAIQIYMVKKNVPHETRFQMDGVTVYLDPSSRQASVRLIENINL